MVFKSNGIILRSSTCKKFQSLQEIKPKSFHMPGERIMVSIFRRHEKGLEFDTLTLCRGQNFLLGEFHQIMFLCITV